MPIRTVAVRGFQTRAMQTVRSASLAAGILLASIVSVATPAPAQFQKGTFEVALRGGGSIDTRRTDHSLGLVWRSLAYSLRDRQQIGVGFGEAIDREGEILGVVRAEANLLLPRAGVVVPYVGAQCGALLRYDDGVAATGSYGLQTGGKIPVSKKFGISLEVGYSLPMTGPQTGAVSVLAGLFWLFPPAPKTPPD